MDYFKLPENYQCIVPASTSSQTSIYAYNARERDQYDLVGYNWVKTRHQTYNYDQDLSTLICLNQEKLVPTDTLNSFILPATIFVICFFNLILKMFMGVRR